MAEKFDIIGEVRGRGAMIAIELVKDRGTKEPAPEAAGALAKACHAEGLLVLTCGTYGNVLRFPAPAGDRRGPPERGTGHHRAGVHAHLSGGFAHPVTPAADRVKKVCEVDGRTPFRLFRAPSLP